MRYATWSAPVDVGAKPPARLGLPRHLFAILSASAVVYVAILSVPFGFGVRSILFGLALAVLFAFRASMFAQISEWFARRRKGSAAAFELYKMSAELDAHPVRIQVVLGTYEIGRDEGIVSFRDGLLAYHGLRTRFALSPESCVESGLAAGLVLPQVAGLQHVVRIAPFERIDPNNDKVCDHLYWRAYNEWRKSRSEQASEVVLPPKRPAAVSDVRAYPAPFPFPSEVFLVLVLSDAFRGNMFSFGVVFGYALLLAIGAFFGRRQRDKFLKEIGT